MNVNLFNSRPNHSPHPSLVRPPETSIEFDQEGKKMSHTSFRKTSFNEAFWEMAKSLPKSQQIPLAANALVSQFQQKGDTLEGREFIRSFTNRFSQEDKTALLSSLEGHSQLKKISMPRRGEFLSLIDSLWNNKPFRDAMEKQPKDFQNPYTRPDNFFFKTSEKLNQDRLRVLPM